MIHQSVVKVFTTKMSVSRNIFLVFPLELHDKMIHQSVVKVFTTKMSVSSCRLDLKYSSLNSKDGDIKCSTTKIKDENIGFFVLRLFLVQTIGNGSCCGFIDDPNDVQTSNNSSIFGSLSLRVIEVSWYCDYSILDLLSQV